MTSHSFDETALRRIYNLLLLKGRCDSMDSQFMEEIAKGDIKFAKTPSASFFSAMANVVDTYIVTFVNEEVSNSNPERHPLAEILISSCADNAKKGETIFLKRAILDCENLFSRRINSYIGSIVLDFIVSSYSTFEKYICMIHDGLLEDGKPSKSRKKKILKILNSSLEGHVEKSDELDKVADDILRDMKFYKSGSEKIEFTFSRLPKISKYCHSRNISEDMNTINIYRNLRNTIHNLGFHSGSSMTSNSNGGSRIVLDKNAPAYFEDFNEAFLLCGKLVDIYRAIVDSIGIEKIDPKFLLEYEISTII